MSLVSVFRAGGIGPEDQAAAGPKIMKPNPTINTNFDSKGSLFYHKKVHYFEYGLLQKSS